MVIWSIHFIQQAFVECLQFAKNDYAAESTTVNTVSAFREFVIR